MFSGSVEHRRVQSYIGITPVTRILFGHLDLVHDTHVSYILLTALQGRAVMKVINIAMAHIISTSVMSCMFKMIHIRAVKSETL